MPTDPEDFDAETATPVAAADVAAGDRFLFGRLTADGWAVVEADNLLTAAFTVYCGAALAPVVAGNFAWTLPADQATPFHQWTLDPNTASYKEFESFVTPAENPSANPRKNVVWTQGYNPSRVAGDHSFYFNLEACYGPAGTEQVEWYPQFFAANQTTSYRPFGIVVNCVTGAGAVSFETGRVDFLNNTDGNAALPFIFAGPMDIRSGLSSNTGSVGYTLYNAGGNIYYAGDANYGLRWDLRSSASVPGIAVWCATGQSHYLFQGLVNNVTKFQVDADGSITGAANLNLAALPTTDPHVAGRVWRSTNDLKISTG